MPPRPTPPRYLTPQALRGLEQYSYKSGTYSWLDNALNPAWTWIASQLPRWVAPNLVTLVGTSFLLSMGVLMWVFDPALVGSAPSFVYAWCAVSVIVYQTLDAVDGKQARRTGSSSPLGQLFDHGCDALGTTPLALALCSVLSLGPSVSAVLLVATIQLPFFLAQLEEHVTHVMRTQVANFGVTEGQFLEAGLIMLTAVAGPNVWDLEVPFTQDTPLALLPGNPATAQGLTLRTATVYSGCFFPVVLGCTSLVNVVRHAKDRAVVLKAVPTLGMELFLLWASVADPTTFAIGEAFHTAPVPFFMCFGAYFTLMVSKLIVSTVCKVEWDAVHLPGMGPLPVLLAMDVVGMLSLPVLALYGAFVVALYLAYVVSVSREIAQHLNIWVLRLGPRSSVALASSASVAPTSTSSVVSVGGASDVAVVANAAPSAMAVAAAATAARAATVTDVVAPSSAGHIMQRSQSQAQSLAQLSPPPPSSSI